MSPYLAALTSFALALYFASALELPSVAGTSADAFLHLPMSRRAKPKALSRRTADLGVSLQKHDFFYTIDLEIGTPPQALSLALDTTRSDTFVLDPVACHAPVALDCSNASITAQEPCVQDIKCLPEAPFYSNDSSTYRTNHTFFFFNTSQSSRHSSGFWAQDTLHLGNHSFSDFDFALATEPGPLYVGVAGLGSNDSEIPLWRGDIKKPYANLLDRLKQQGVIQRKSFSLWLDGQNSGAAGSVLFGGIDKAKLSSDLYKMPLVWSTPLAVHMTGISIYNATGAEQPFLRCDHYAVLDSTSKVSVVPISWILPLFQLLNATIDAGEALVPCNALSSKDGGLGIQLGGIDITVGFSDLFVKVSSTDEEGTEYCIPGFLAGSSVSGQVIIGENVLKTLYVVYDLESLEVGIAAAQTGVAASNSSIQPLSTGIPGKRAQENTKNIMNADPTFGFGTTSITLMTPSVSHAPSASVIGTEPGLTAFLKVPKSVPEKIVIGAKVNSSASVTRASPLLATLTILIVALLF